MDLVRDGVAVLVPGTPETIIAAVRDCQETEDPTQEDKRLKVTGGFGKARAACEQYSEQNLRLWGMVKGYIEAAMGTKVSHFPDGLCVRTSMLGGEGPHRDDAPPDTWSSWVADTPSQFTCVLGSHRGIEGKAKGLVPVEPGGNQFTTIQVPAGHIFVFNPRSIHKVTRVDYRKAPQVRVFFGVRAGTNPPSPGFTNKMLNGEYVGAPSGQNQRTYPRLWESNFPQKAAEYATKLKPSCREERVVTEKSAKKIQAAGLPVKKVAGKYIATYPKRFPQPVPTEWLRKRTKIVKLALKEAGVPNADQVVDNHFSQTLTN